jgi:hypothetical protein
VVCEVFENNLGLEMKEHPSPYRLA